jgi:hypothetical protein
MIAVPFLTKKEIEGKAGQLLKEAIEGGKIEYLPPIDLEAIIENHLKLGLEIIDFGDSNIFGGLDPVNSVVKINAEFDPFTKPSLQGLYHYTLGHEVGHYELHVPLLDLREHPILCRTSEANAQIEWQADFFSASLIMPRDLVIKAYSEMYRTLIPHKSEEILLKAINDPKFKKIVRCKKKAITVKGVLEVAFEDLAKIFAVSGSAMVNRLKELGLLIVGGQITDQFDQSFAHSV